MLSQITKLVGSQDGKSKPGMSLGLSNLDISEHLGSRMSVCFIKALAFANSEPVVGDTDYVSFGHVQSRQETLQGHTVFRSCHGRYLEPHIITEHAPSCYDIHAIHAIPSSSLRNGQDGLKILAGGNVNGVWHTVAHYFFTRLFQSFAG